MVPEIITSYDVFKNITQNNEILFWIVEYNPETYDSLDQKYSILRNEILQHPQNYAQRLNEGKYRIWTTTPYEKLW